MARPKKGISNEESMSQALSRAADTAQNMTGDLESIRDSLRDRFATTVMVPSGNEAAARLLRFQRIETAGRSSNTIQHMLHIMVPDPAARTIAQQFVLEFAHQMAEDARTNVERQLTHALVDADYVKNVGDAVLSAKQVLRSCKEVSSRLSSLEGNNASGRGVFLKTQDDEIGTFSTAVASLDILHQRKNALLDARDNVQGSMAAMLTNASMDMNAVPQDLMTTNQTHQTVITKQLDLINESICPGTAAARGRYTELQVPSHLDDMLKGTLMIKNFDDFMSKNRHHFPITRTYTRRVGHDVNPTKGIFYKPPTKADGYAAVPKSMREAYAAESAKIWTELSTRAPSTILRDIQRSFHYGRDMELVGSCMPDDGVTAYWAILSMYRPMDATYHDDIENWLDACYWKVNKYDGSIVDTLKAIKLRIDEAKLLGIRIKWHKTGKKWITLLAKRPNFAVALEPFKRKVPDTDDCVLVLSDLVLCMQHVAGEEFTAPSTNSPFYPEQGMLASTNPFDEAGMLAATETEQQDLIMNDCLMSQQDAFAISGYRGGRTTKRQRTDDDGSGVVPGRRLQMAMGNYDQSSPRRQQIQPTPRRSGFGSNMRGGRAYQKAFEAAQMKHDPARCCFEKVCPAPRKSHFELCTTCHKNGISRGTFEGKDGVTYPMLSINSSTAEQRKANTMKMVKAASAWRRGPAARQIANMAVQDEGDTIAEQEREYEACMQELGIMPEGVMTTIDEQADYVMGMEAPGVNDGLSLHDGSMHSMLGAVPGAGAAYPQEQQALAAQILQLQQQEVARQKFYADQQ